MDTRPFRVITVIAVLCDLVLLSTLSMVKADPSPPGCNTNGLNMTISGPLSGHNGDVVQYAVVLTNPNISGNCDVTGVSVTFTAPAADGTATGTTTTLGSNLDFPLGTTMTWNSTGSGGAIASPALSITLALDPGVTTVTAEAFYVGIIHISPNDTVVTGSNTTQPLPTTLLRGNLHSHSSYSRKKLSDPEGWILDLGGFSRKRVSASPSFLLDTYAPGVGLDVWAITDHVPALIKKSENWNATADATDSSTSGVVGLRGFEWSATQGTWQYAGPHINVFGTSDFPDSSVRNEVDLFGWLSSRDAIAQINHPDNEKYGWYTYAAVPSDRVKLFEVGSGQRAADQLKGVTIDKLLNPLEKHLASLYTPSLNGYVNALTHGWKVGATNNQDSHFYFRSIVWIPEGNHTGIWTRGNRTEDVMEALKKRWVYATEDPNFSLSLTAIDNAGTHFMGAEQIAGVDGELHLHLSANDNESIGSIWVLSGPSGGSALSGNWWDYGVHFEQTTDQSVDKDIILEYQPNHWYLVVVREILPDGSGGWNGDGDFIVSSPIWTAPSP